MKNINMLSDQEFIDYVENKGMADPIIQRFLKMTDEYANLAHELSLRGMGRHGKFWLDGLHYDIVEYIDKLQRNTDFLEDELGRLNQELGESLEEQRKLSARSVAELISELNSTIHRAYSNAAEANKRADESEKKMADALDKLNVWDIMRGQ